MTPPARRRVLILGGTSEALDLARELVRTPGIEPTSALAGRTRRPRLPPGRVRIGGFGGEAGLATYLRERRVDVLIDATHPFATRMSAHARGAAGSTGLPLLVLTRPSRPLPAGAIERADLDAALGAVPAGARHVLVTFRADLADAAQRPHRITVRAIEPPERPLPDGVRWRLARGPFPLEAERQLLERLGVDVVIAKASGGPVIERKLQAALELGLAVIVIARSPAAAGTATVETVPDAVGWLEDQRRGRST